MPTAKPKASHATMAITTPRVKNFPMGEILCEYSPMPKGPQGQKRPADVIGNAVHVMRIATGEVEEKSQPKSAAKAGAQSAPSNFVRFVSLRVLCGSPSFLSLVLQD